ncbi:MAG: TRAP transporter substrate-binding protein DctP [Hydrogenophaga sp.]|nr:TRAP transporter substrate-binding protein DctP [Hydrogenophaga sp.]
MKSQPMLRILKGVTILVAATISSYATAATEWKFFTYFPVNDKPAQLNRDFAQDVFNATEGKLRIRVMAAGELPFKAPDVLRAVATNQVQMGDVAIGFLAGELPALNVLQLPFLCTSYPQFDRAIAAVAPIAEEEVQKRYKVSIGMHWTMPPQNIWLNRTVEGIGDLKGLKVRAWNPEQVEMMKRLGGNAISITSAEVIPALERRVIDAAITSALSANDWKAYDIVKTGYLVNMTMGHQIMLINDAQMQALEPGVRATLQAKLKEWTPKFRAMSEQGEMAARANLQAHKVTLKEASAQDLRQARALMEPAWNEWASRHGPVAQQLLSAVRTGCTLP